ncbi:MAG: hypothetical protein KGV56_02445 [Gammaproteobacteria bacterium]|nr:hypothetical protein [Gammaproteobacteria bacterium]
MYKNIREEGLKNKVGNDWFADFDTTEILGNIDFSVFPKQKDLFSNQAPLLWAEAKTGDYDITTMFVQLVLTIGKARTFDKMLPPAFLGAFDFVKMAFVPYIAIQDIFYINDFNWNVTPSNHDTKEFQLIKERIEKTLQLNTYIFSYTDNAKELTTFIAKNIAKAKENSKIKINKNNFIPIYLRWLEAIKPIIQVDWGQLKGSGIIDADFYLADLFVDDKNTQDISDDESIRDNLFVMYQNGGYKIAKENIHQMFDATISLQSQAVYQAFWKHYKRPPQRQWQEYIIERRDLIVPQDIRERKGAYFTPRQWVELSQKTIADYLGDDWQDNYYIWDCAAGTGNLLAGLTNKYNIWASTIDQADVNVMHERIKNGANLLESHIFQFDFLNDSFDKLPQGLQEIINDGEQRKKLIVYINPPYAEADNRKGEKRKGVAISQIKEKYSAILGKAKREMFAQFLIRIYNEIPSSKIANFSKLKNLQSSNFKKFRQHFTPTLERLFIVPAATFDNVTGQFPIGFFIWDCEKKAIFTDIETDIYDKNGVFVGNKVIYSNDGKKLINDWIKQYRYSDKQSIGTIIGVASDFQNQRLVRIGEPFMKVPALNHNWQMTEENLLPSSIYYAVRHCIPADWLNDRDQFLYPHVEWETDSEFCGDCLAFTLFHGQNRIQSSVTVETGHALSLQQQSLNHWLPFTENEVNAKDCFASHFMTDFIKEKQAGKEITFSDEALSVFNAGRELWHYYHSCDDININASLYDIREYFQGRNEKTGRMNNKSDDARYNELIGNLRIALKDLAGVIKPKVYRYGFLRE